MEKMLAQRVYEISLGWEDCNGFDTLKDDPLYALALGGKPAAQPTLSRFENAVGKKKIAANEFGACLFIDRNKVNPPKQIVIDMDAMDDPAHGQ